MKILNGEEPRKLSDVKLRKIKPTEKKQVFSDGYGLSLSIETNGSKYWRFNYRFLGKQQTLSLGVYPGVSLADARSAHRIAYNQLAENINPAEARKLAKLSVHQANANTFEAISNEWIDVHMSDKTEQHRSRATSILQRYITPYIGNRDVRDITALELLGVLRKIEATGALNTAHRARGTVQQIFSYAIATGRADRNVAQDLQGTLKTYTEKHRTAITEPKLLGKLLRDIDYSRASLVVKTAMRISPILFQRPGEIRQMEWSEIDFEKAIWCIPAEKMKMRNDHIVPLPTQAITLLKEIYTLSGQGKFVFPSARGASRCLSENAVRVALRDLGYDNETVTPHGFRATARTLLDEALEFRVDLIEQQLAHAVKDANGRAYNRTKFLPQRAEMMQAWADYLDRLKAEASK